MKKNFLILLPLFLLLAACSEDDVLAPINSELFQNIEFQTIELVDDSKRDITDISFYNDNDGVICGSSGFFAKTTDGGMTWTKLNVGVNHSFLTTFMLDNNTFFTARRGLYKTSNSGSNFSEIGNLSSGTSSVFNIYFRNNSIGFVTHDLAIKKTIDGGNTWEEKYFTNSVYSIYDLEFTSDNIGYASGGAFWDNYNKGQIVKTTDGGETWTKILTTISIRSISFFSDNIGFYSNVNEEIFKTTDGGVSWNKISTLQYYPTDILFLNNEIGFVATYEGKILMTKDGGNTWQIAYEKTTVPINRIIKTSNSIFAVGNDGLLLKSK
ncbi:MAG: hypothetical protein GXX85_15220 [Ignavibacteria bacterium]|nr:hypothetical protein [Ignavibacteria bacterium]